MGNKDVQKVLKPNKREVGAKVLRVRKGESEEQIVYGKSLESCGNINGKKIFFLDLSALIHFAGPLYGGFLVNDHFTSERIIPGENNIFVTDEQILRRLRVLEEKRRKKIYRGYTAFLERNLVIVSAEDAIESIKGQNILSREFSNDIILKETEPFAHVLGSLYYLYHKNVDPILITFDTGLEKLVLEKRFEVYKVS